MVGQEDFGSTLKKSYMRLLGALSGGILAFVALFIWGHNCVLNGLILSVAIFGFALLINGSKKNQAGGVFGALTLISVLMSGSPTLHTVLLRLFEISLGVLVALSVSKLILPIHTTHRLKKLLSSSLVDLCELYAIKFCNAVPRRQYDNPYKYETQILRAFGDQERLLLNAVLDRRDKKAIIALYEQIILCERGVFRSCIFLSRIIALNAQNQAAIKPHLAVDQFHATVVKSMHALARESMDISLHIQHELAASLNDLTVELSKQALAATVQQRIYLYTFIGSCQYLCHELQLLATHVFHLSRAHHAVYTPHSLAFLSSLEKKT